MFKITAVAGVKLQKRLYEWSSGTDILINVTFRTVSKKSLNHSIPVCSKNIVSCVYLPLANQTLLTLLPET